MDPTFLLSREILWEIELEDQAHNIFVYFQQIKINQADFIIIWALS